MSGLLPGNLLTTRQAAKRLKRSIKMVQHYIRTGQLKSHRLFGGRNLIALNDLEKFTPRVPGSHYYPD